MYKEKNKQRYNYYSKKIRFGIAPAIAISAILLSKDMVGPRFLFLVDIGVGIFIGIKLRKGKK
jgi:hypothetical protein